MVLLYIYLGSIVLTIATSKLFDKYMEKEIENRGYEYKDKKKNIYKSIFYGIQEFAFCSIPIINLFFTTYLFFGFEKMSNEIISEDIEKGTLIRKEEKEEPKLIEAVEINNNLVEDSKVIVYRVDNKEKKEMTREEKIEFLKEEYSRLTGNQMQSENINQKKFRLGKKKNNV